MGVKGLQCFVERCCPQACVCVNLREMASQHVVKTQKDPSLVVDGMACLRHWYSCQDWVCGGQWKEYMDGLKNWVNAFTAAGIKLVFFFDGVVEEQKRAEWVKRRHRVDGDVAKVFSHIKQYGKEPPKDLFCLPPSLATFTPFALKSFGQTVITSVREADYEIASYARQHGSMGILGQDSDFIIYDSVPYLSVAKLQINSLTTVMYDRWELCRSIGLPAAQLPLLACLLGNDVVSEEQMRQVRQNAMNSNRGHNSTVCSLPPRSQMVMALVHLLRSLSSKVEEETGSIPQLLNISTSQKELLKKGICSYLLPGQNGFEMAESSSSSIFAKHLSTEIVKACKDKHVAAEGFMVYNVVCAGTTDCSNSLEDGTDAELLPQALVYKLCRQRIYSLLLLEENADSTDTPAVKEWFVFPGNPLKEPELVQPIAVISPNGQPNLDMLWFGTGPGVPALRLNTFLSIFDCEDYAELYGVIEDYLLAALCLITYIVLQVQTLSREDVDAYLSQTVCLRLYSPLQLQSIELPVLCGRAVQLGSLYVRGLSHLLGANTASGGPLPTHALMPWHIFDGRLFHSKYLQAHSGKKDSELLNADKSCLAIFFQLKEKLLDFCKKRGRVLLSRPRETQPSDESRSRGFYSGERESWKDRGAWRGGHREQRGWWRGGEDRRDTFNPHHRDGPHQNTTWHPRRTRAPSHHHRGRYQLAPRWSQPPSP